MATELLHVLSAGDYPFETKTFAELLDHIYELDRLNYRDKTAIDLHDLLCLCIGKRLSNILYNDDDEAAGVKIIDSQNNHRFIQLNGRQTITLIRALNTCEANKQDRLDSIAQNVDLLRNK